MSNKGEDYSLFWIILIIVMMKCCCHLEDMAKQRPMDKCTTEQRTP